MLLKQWVGVENVLPVSVPCRQVFNNLWQIFNLQGSKCIVLYIYHKTRATYSNYHAHKGGNGSFPHSRNQTQLSMKKSETLPYYNFWMKSKNFLNNINTKKKKCEICKKPEKYMPKLFSTTTHSVVFSKVIQMNWCSTSILEVNQKMCSLAISFQCHHKILKHRFNILV